MPNFDLWHSCRKWAIYSLLFFAWDNDRPTWVILFFSVGWCVVLWTMVMHNKSPPRPPPHTHTHTPTHIHTRLGLLVEFRLCLSDFTKLKKLDNFSQTPPYQLTHKKIFYQRFSGCYTCAERKDGGCNGRFEWRQMLLKVGY
jgi:hypothetical protein